MSDPIDLDLVELRCRLRGWTCVRYNEDPYGHETFVPLVDCDTDDGVVTIYQHGEAHGPCVEIKTLTDNRRVFGKRTWFRQEVIQTLTAPRWTLERLLSEPPEGWRVIMQAELNRRYWQAFLAWGESYSDYNDELSCTLSAHPQSLLSVTINQTCASHADLARLAERHKAAAELALILAEVKP